MSREKLVFVNESDPAVFAKKCNELLNNGYVISSTSCGFVDSAEYDFCGVYDAILILDEEVVIAGEVFDKTADELTSKLTIKP